jgi:hypothetical protein
VKTIGGGRKENGSHSVRCRATWKSVLTSPIGLSVGYALICACRNPKRPPAWFTTRIRQYPPQSNRCSIPLYLPPQWRPTFRGYISPRSSSARKLILRFSWIDIFPTSPQNHSYLTVHTEYIEEVHKLATVLNNWPRYQQGTYSRIPWLTGQRAAA